jgi:hypothetical protein
MQKMVDMGRLAVRHRMQTVLLFAEGCGTIKSIQMIRAANFVYGLHLYPHKMTMIYELTAHDKLQRLGHIACAEYEEVTMHSV